MTESVLRVVSDCRAKFLNATYLRTPVLWRERTTQSVAAMELSAKACSAHVMYQSHCKRGVMTCRQNRNVVHKPKIAVGIVSSIA